MSKIFTANRFAAGFLSAAVLSVPAAIVGTTPAHADTPETPTASVQAAETPRWTSHDKKVMKAANKACRKIKDDLTWEYCVVGAFHLNDADSSSGRVLTVDDYKITNAGKIVLVQR